MKKVFIIILILVLLLAVFVACDNNDSSKEQQITVNIVLGTDGRINWLYENRVGISPIDENRKITFGIDKNDFESLETLIPKKVEIDAPQNYYFGGWYFEEHRRDSTTDFNHINWIERVSKAKNSLVNIYAIWIPATYVDIRFDLGDSGAYFFYNNPNYDSTSRTWWSANIFINSDDSVEKSMPDTYIIAVPDGIRFNGWYFEDGSKVTTENARLQKANSNGYIKAIPHWTTDAVVHYTCNLHTYSIGFPYTFRINTKESAQMSGTVLENDFEELINVLPKREDFEVEKIDYSTNEKTILQESFAVFEWKITGADRDGYYGEKVDLTYENWLQTVETSKTKSIHLALYYELADINKNIDVICYPQNVGGLTFTDEALAKYGVERGDIIFSVERNDFYSLLDFLPTAEDICGLIYIDGDSVKIPIEFESITWKIAIEGIDWDSRIRDTLIDLTEENWIEYTKSYNALYFSFTYVLKYDDSPMNVYLSNSWIHIDDKEYELKYKIPTEDGFVLKSSSRLDMPVVRNDYNALIAMLPTCDDVELTLYTNRQYVDCDKTIKSIVWKIVTGGYNGLEQEYDLNESNYEFVAKRSRNMTLKAYFELND